MKRVLYIFGKLRDADVEWLVDRGRALEVAEGTTLVREGSPVDAIYIVLEGSLAVKSGERTIAQLGRGEVVGELSFLDTRPPSATVVATEASLVLSISRTELHAKLRDDDAFAARFYQALGVFLAARLRSTITRLGIAPDSSSERPRARAEDDDLDLGVLDDVSVAGARFDWLLRTVRARRAVS
jgi:CRP-like cAMP-binding protein